MKKESRKVIIAGNWKMNMTPSAAKTAVEETARLTEGKNGCEVVLCVPFVDIANAVEAAKGTQVKIGAQNVHFEKKGAFTGEISADMLNECGVEYVIIGHSGVAVRPVPIAQTGSYAMTTFFICSAGMPARSSFVCMETISSVMPA